MQNKQLYIEIEGQQVPVIEEVYRAYKQPLWAEHKRQEREKRCAVSDGKGGLKRCNGDCSKCPYDRTGRVLSLDAFEEESGQAVEAESPDIADIAADAILLEELWAAVAELDPDNRRIIELFSEGHPEREIAAEVGLSQKAINKRKAKLFGQLYEKLKDFR